MRKIMIVLFSIVFIFALTGCNNNKKQDTQNYENYAPPKNMPIYPEAKRFGDVKSSKYVGYTYLTWYYETAASANEIIEFFKIEFQNLGLDIEGYATYALGNTFGVGASKDGESYFIGSISFSETENFSEEINPDTPGRQYKIIINIDKWNEL